MAQSKSGLRNMTVGSPAGHIFYFALPLLAGSFLQQLYNMVDSFVVGKYVGDSALAAVGVGFPVIFMFTSLFMGLSNGGTVVIAQFYGAGRMDRVRDAVDTIYTSFVCAAVPVTLAALLAVKPMLWLLRVDESAYHEAWVYLMVVCAGLMGTIGYNLNAGILGGLGNSRSTLLFLSIAAVMNIFLDFALVLWADMGVLGVALGTIISQAFSWLFGIFFINRRYPQIRIRPFCRRFDRELFRQIMGIGLPAGIQMSLVAVGSMVIMSKVNSYGEAYTAGYNVGYRLDQLAFLPVQSLSNAVTAFVGQNIGAKRLDRRPGDGGIGGGVVVGHDGPSDPLRTVLHLHLLPDPRRHRRRGGVPAGHHALLRPLCRVLHPQQRHAGGGGERLSHGEHHPVFDLAAGALRIPDGSLLRPGVHVLRLRRGLGGGLCRHGGLLSLRPLAAPRIPGGGKTAGIRPYFADFFLRRIVIG